MRPAILIIEPRREIADALEEAVTSANYTAVVRPYVDRLTDIGITPAAIIVRIVKGGVSEPAHAALGRCPIGRPPVVAIAWEDDEVAEATRLKFDVVLRAPNDVSRLYQELTKIVHA